MSVANTLKHRGDAMNIEKPHQFCREGIAELAIEAYAPLEERIAYDIRRDAASLATQKRQGKEFAALTLIELEEARDYLNEVLA